MSHRRLDCDFDRTLLYFEVHGAKVGALMLFDTLVVAHAAKNFRHLRRHVGEVDEAARNGEPACGNGGLELVETGVAEECPGRGREPRRDATREECAIDCL